MTIGGTTAAGRAGASPTDSDRPWPSDRGALPRDLPQDLGTLRMGPSTQEPDLVARSEAGATPGGALPAPNGEWTIAVHRDLKAVEARWRDLEEAGHLTAFQGFDWISVLMERVGSREGATLHIVEVRDRTGRTRLILPFCIRLRFGVSVLGFVDFGVCDYGAPLLAEGAPPDWIVADDLLSAILKRVPRVDLIALEKMPARVGTVENPLARLSGRSLSPLRCYRVPVEGPADTILKRALRPSIHRDLTKARRRAERGADVRLTVAADAAEADAIMDAMLEQRRERFAQMGRFNLLGRPEIAAFYRDAARLGLHSGSVRLFSLTVDGRIAATAYTLVRADALSLVVQTMDRARRNLSPGGLITAQVLEWAAAQGIPCFDLTIGHQPFKVDFGSREDDLYVFERALTLKGRIASAAVLARTRALAALKAHPRLFESLRALRQRLRR